jgi:hypothetical protein
MPEVTDILESSQTQLSEELQQILEEIAEYQIDLVEDPTGPELGTRYLQERIATCRKFLNRVQFYLQKVGKYERELKIDLKIKEMDIDLKINGKLADDTIVRQQPSIDDRKALAISQLRDEHEALAEIRLKMLDVQETQKLLKMKYGDLRAANADIKAQRQLIKDDMQAWMGGEEGYTRPQPQPDGSAPKGMPPPVVKKVNPRDLLDPDKEPDRLPPPRDAEHVKQISEFLASETPGQVQAEENHDNPWNDPNIKPTDYVCDICGEPQWDSPSGIMCINGHGGASGTEREEENAPIKTSSVSYDDLLR